MKSDRPIKIGVGQPAFMLLNQWCEHVHRCFGGVPYLVGSSVFGKEWRDIDIRVILEDDEWERWFGKRDRLGSVYHLNDRWSAIMVAFCAWGKAATGLPIDFQVYPRSGVSEEEWEQPRCALGCPLKPQPWEPREPSPET